MIKKTELKYYLIVLPIIMIVTTGCYSFYRISPRVNADPQQTDRNVDSLSQQNRYFILRSGNNSWHMKNLKLSDDRKMLSCTLDSVSYVHQLHFHQGYKGKMRYKKTPVHKPVLNEVHLFIPEEDRILTGAYTLMLDKVQRIEVLEKDKKRTTNSYVLGAIGYTVGTMALVGIIALATKSSCPFVSAYDGKEFSLQGEIYGGAIYPQLARNDYMPLKMAPLQDGSLQLKISNELQERQYTDFADLWVITHEEDQKILVDQQGRLFSITDPKIPISATLNGNRNVLPGVMQPGDYEMLYLDDSSQKDARNEVVLQFNNDDAPNGKLILTLKNSYWLDLLYGELAKGFGTYYMTYLKNQRTKPAAELLKWIKEQQIPLTISLKTKAGWKEIESITTIGPLATREMVVPVDLTETGDGPIEIKLSSGFMFWEIDYAAIDYTPDKNILLEKLSPNKATDDKGKNVLQPLLKEDGKYLEQPDIGNVATLVYQSRLRGSSTSRRMYILHSKGYYEHIRDFKNKPDIVFLNKFKQRDAFPVFGMQLYQTINAQNLQSLGSKN